jgi:dihydrofolate reductase
MRTVTYGAACSLDGFITDRGGAIDWLHFSPDVGDFMASYWATVDTIIMGRKTWEAAASQRDDGGSESAAMPGITATYVFSRTLDRIDDPKVQLVKHDAGDFVRRLKGEPGKGICVLGGGDFGRSLLAEGLVDEVGLNIHPILLGGGVPLFLDAGRRIGLDLIESRVMEGGCVLARYRVAR